jgi:hypothetical protein
MQVAAVEKLVVGFRASWSVRLQGLPVMCGRSLPSVGALAVPTGYFEELRVFQAGHTA